MSETAAPLVVTPSDGSLVVVGEIDASTVTTLANHLAPTPAADIVLDMSGVQFIDSSGLRVLIEAHQRREAVGRRLVIKSPSSTVRRLLEISGLTDDLHVDLAELP